MLAVLWGLPAVGTHHEHQRVIDGCSRSLIPSPVLLSAPSSIKPKRLWAEEYRHDHRETGPWHYIDIPLADSKIDLTRECPNGDRVL